MLTKIKTLLAIALCAFALTSAKAAVVTDSYSGSIDTTITYSWPNEEFSYDQFYTTYLEYSAWYDTDTGVGSYSYTAYGPLGSLHIESETSTGKYGWAWASYYTEAFMPDFSSEFWFSAWFS